MAGVEDTAADVKEDDAASEAGSEDLEAESSGSDDEDEDEEVEGDGDEEMDVGEDGEKVPEVKGHDSPVSHLQTQDVMVH